jgi:hypothetical protein
MSDNFIRFRSILKMLKKLYPVELKGNQVRRLTTMAALISGIIGSKSCQLPKASCNVTDGIKPESRVKKFYRLIKNKQFDYETFFMPYAKALLSCLGQGTLAFVIDGSTVARNCISLIASVIYKNRALPICWITITGGKGHLPEEFHIKLVKQLHQMVPDNITLVFLADGEFDGAILLKTIKSYNWLFACRTCKNRLLIENEELFSFRHIDPGNEEYFRIPDVFLKDHPDFQCHAVLWWQRTYKEPVYLFTNIDLAYEATYWYKKRYRIETMFSDKKSRGFHLHKSHIEDPERVDRLLIVASLAYIFIICFGIYAVKNGFDKIIHRTDRCDLSLCQLGYRLLDYLISKKRRLPVFKQLYLFANP